MEWVETTARTIEEAKELALDQLGVHEEDAEFDVVEEPRPGLFGRIRGEARVRARVRPTQPRPKAERRERKRKTNGADETDAAAPSRRPMPPTATAVRRPSGRRPTRPRTPRRPKPRSRPQARPAAARSARPAGRRPPG